MRVGLITLGCDKNTVDNEYLAGLLEDRGCDVVALPFFDPAQHFDAIVVMTCGFICDAKRQSIETIMELANNKPGGNPGRLYVAGCLAQRYAADLLEGIPEMDGIAGVGQCETLAEMILAQGDTLPEGKACVAETPSTEIYHYLRRRRLDNKPYAFLKIADGCNHTCSFCSIPLMKGRFRSVPSEILLREAQELLKQGVRELNLVAQDISVYGADKKSERTLPELLRRLCELPGEFWIRCLYCYPGGVTDELLETMAAHDKIVPYLDIPLQHLDAGMLKRMKRPFAELDAERLVKRIRAAVPGVTLRTTMLVGFPGESPQAHRRMLDGMERIGFERLGAFAFSSEEGTEAAGLPRQVGKNARQKRMQAVMELQADLSAEWNARRVGQRVRVLVDEYDEDRRLWIGRSAAEAPEVDGVVYLTSENPLSPGDFVTAEVVAADVYDVEAKVISDPR